MSNIKKYLLIGLLWVISSPIMMAQNINTAEYFFDADPGIGLGTPLSISISDTVSWTNQNISTASLSAGFHNLYVRVRYTTDEWSTAENRPFFLSSTSGAMTLITTISEAEYFFDNDPGIGIATPLSISTALDSLSWINQAISTASLSAGFHNLHVRVKDGDGRWSTTENRPFYLSVESSGTP
jgi:hypothetical protein